MDPTEEALALIEESQSALKDLEARVTDIENNYFNPDPNISPEIFTNLKQFLDANVPPVVLPTAVSGRSHKSANQSIPDSTTTKVVWNVNDFANNITWDGTNNRFAVVNGGIYFMAASVVWVFTAANAEYHIYIEVNGSAISHNLILSNASAGSAVSSLAFDTLFLVAGDYVEIFVQQLTGGAQDVNGSSTILSYFELLKIN